MNHVDPANAQRIQINHEIRMKKISERNKGGIPWKEVFNKHFFNVFFKFLLDSFC